MSQLDVVLERRIARKGAGTRLARIRFFSCMRPEMCLERALLTECLSTRLARKRPLARVDPHVNPKRAWRYTGRRALETRNTFRRMHLFVLYPLGTRRESRVAHLAHEITFRRMRLQVFCETVALDKGIATMGTWIRLDACMHPLVQLA